MACIEMLAGWYGKAATIRSLRQRYWTVGDWDVRALLAALSDLGFSARSITLDQAHIGALPRPSIATLDGRFVVVERVHGRWVHICDPVHGRQRLEVTPENINRLSSWLEIFPTAPAQVQRHAPVALRQLFAGWHEGRKLAYQALSLTLFLQLAAFTAPLQMQLVVDEVVARSDQLLLPVLVAAGFVLVVVRAGVEAVRNWSLQLFGLLLHQHMTSRTIGHMLRLPAAFYARYDAGELTSRMSSITAIQETFTRGVASALLDGAMALAALIFLASYSFAAATVAAAALVIGGCIAFGVAAASGRHLHEQLTNLARERLHLMETVQGIASIKMMGAARLRLNEWQRLYADNLGTGYRLSLLRSNTSAGLQVVFALAFAIVLYKCANQLLGGAGSVGTLVATIGFFQIFFDRSQSLLSYAVDVGLLTIHLHRTGDIFSSEPESLATSSGRCLGGIELRKVSFRYSGSERPILRDVNLCVEPGDFVAIVGPSGGGKSTLLRLILGLHEPSAGEILLDDERSTAAGWRRWRAASGVVAQDDQLFSGSIASNIAQGDPQPDMARIEEAARSALIHGEIMAMPMRYSSLIGEMGAALSTGQRQRILFARALYRRPSILILDEGTANLDREAEIALADYVESLPITRIVVAHRPELVLRAHKRFCLTEGVLRELSLPEAQKLMEASQ